MRIALLPLVLAAPLALTATPGYAQDVQAPQVPVAANHLMIGDNVAAERTLRYQLRANPDMPELLLNLAVVCARTGRIAEARALYERVLAQKDVAMDLTTGTSYGSHAIARVSLDRLDSSQISQR